MQDPVAKERLQLTAGWLRWEVRVRLLSRIGWMLGGTTEACLMLVHGLVSIRQKTTGVEQTLPNQFTVYFRAGVTGTRSLSLMHASHGGRNIVLSGIFLAREIWRTTRGFENPAISELEIALSGHSTCIIPYMGKFKGWTRLKADLTLNKLASTFVEYLRCASEWFSPEI